MSIVNDTQIKIWRDNSLKGGIGINYLLYSNWHNDLIQPLFLEARTEPPNAQTIDKVRIALHRDFLVPNWTRIIGMITITGSIESIPYNQILFLDIFPGRNIYTIRTEFENGYIMYTLELIGTPTGIIGRIKALEYKRFSSIVFPPTNNFIVGVDLINVTV